MDHNQINYENVLYKDECGINAFITQIVSTENHWHEELEIIYVIEKSIDMIINERSYTLASGDIAVINPNVVHRLYTNSEDNIILVMQVAKNIFTNLGIPENKIHIKFISGQIKDTAKQAVIKSLQDQCKQIVLSLQERREKDDALSLFATSMQLVTMLYENFSEGAEDSDNVSAQRNSKHIIKCITKVFHYIEQHYTEKVSIEDVAKASYISSSHLSHILKLYTGESFLQFLNRYRIKCIAEDLLSTDDSILTIYSRHGFNNSKTFNRVFKNMVGCSPTEYRKNGVKKEKAYAKPSKKVADYRDVDWKIVNDSELDKNHAPTQQLPDNDIILEPTVRIDSTQEGKGFSPYWKKLMCAGRAHEILRASWQEQLKTIQQKIGFEYIRFHGLFNDEMGVVQRIDDRYRYNFDYVDQVFDFLLEQRVRPFVEISFMPEAFASDDRTIFWYKGNVSMPKNVEAWCDFIQSFMEHIVDRYGKKEIDTWYFEIWNEPDLEGFWLGDLEDYLHFYGYTTKVIKRISPQSKVGGPACSGQFWKQTIIQDFIKGCYDNDYSLDFLSVHIYQSDYIELDDKRVTENYDAPHIVRDRLQNLQDYVRNHEQSPLEIHVTEWNSSARKDNLTHDTAYKGPFVMKTVSQCDGVCDSLGYRTFTDIMEEDGVPQLAFYGGFGLINKWGLKKPSYFAYQCLNRMGPELLMLTDDYMVTRTHRGLQILAWNYIHYAKPNNEDDVMIQNYYNRYHIFKQASSRLFTFEIEGLQDHACIIKSSKLTRDAGSIYDYWVRNGALEYPNKEELGCLKTMNHMQNKMWVKQKGEALEVKLELPPHGFELLEIRMDS